MQNINNEQTSSSEKNNSAKVRFITKNDLPLSCPLPSASQWSAHPRVFLKLDNDGKAVCPYCSNTYILQQDS